MSDIAFYNIDTAGNVVFSMKNITREISGPEEALQLVAFAMFTDPGSCFFARQDGGGFLSMIGKNIPRQQQLRIDATVFLKQAMATISRSQRPDRPSNATVIALELIDVEGIPEETRIKVKVRIRLASGNSFSASFTGQVG